MNGSGLPFDDIRALVKALPQVDDNALAQAKERNQRISERAGPQGQLASICEWLAGWSGHRPEINRPLVALFAGSHSDKVHCNARSVADEVADISSGGGMINQICASNDLGLKVLDLALQIPVGDITKEVALQERDCAATIAFGMEAIAGGTDLLCLGAVEINNSISAATILSTLYGEISPDYIFSEPTETMTNISKMEIVEAALTCHAGHVGDPLEALRRFGGREMSALCGAILAARMEHIPVILDGYSALTAAAILKALSPDAVQHCVVGQVAQGGLLHKLADLLELPHLLSLDLMTGSGCGAGLAAGVVKTAAQIHNGVELRTV